MLSAHGRLWLLGASAVAFDLGIQAALVAHQTIVYGIEPGARSRVNAVLVVGMFVGMAAGAALGSMLFARWGWLAVTALASSAAASALLVRLWPAARPVSARVTRSPELAALMSNRGPCIPRMATCAATKSSAAGALRRDRAPRPGDHRYPISTVDSSYPGSVWVPPS